MAPRSRRTLLALAGATLTGGCTSVLGSGSSETLPVLVSLTVANDTDSARDYRVQVQYAADIESTLETVFESSGSLNAREETELDGDWPTDPGRFRTRIAVDGGDWHSRDHTDRLARDERICYRQELAISTDGVDSLVNLGASCPE